MGLALLRGIRNGSLLEAGKVSLMRLTAAFSAAMVLGTLLGLLIGTLPVARRALGPLALGLQTLPSIFWPPLAVVWFGHSERAILVVTLIGALLPVTISPWRTGLQRSPRSTFAPGG